ncbi:MAG TPA: aminotransferase class I/II-fold pyridoxal phosphate-dependent enzyme [Candidatus Sumerlaeota bacterium]|nr:aminotransferase class I/II-fold pyridoxal phosphate-dependent enzyme [Candidatus Sumerlaeota bacterium]
MKISKRAAVIKPSLTLALTAKAKAMQAQGIDVVSFGAGEPDFDTPDFIKNVAIEDLQKGVTKYTAERGGPDLLKAVCETLQRDYGLKYETNQVMVSVGGKHSLYNAIFCMVDEGDEVIIPAPYWLTYPEQVRASGGVPVIVDCPPSTGFKITADRLRAAITPRTVAFVLNSPSNPTGAVYTKEELLAIGRVLEENPHVNLISDDLYQKLVYAPAEFHSLPAMLPSLLPRTIIVNGLSKAYSMTGWRLGWAAGPKEFMEACANLQGRFWAFHDTLLGAAGALDTARFKKVGADVGVDRARFDACVDGEQTRDRIGRALEEARRYDIPGPGAILVNGRLAPEPPAFLPPFEYFKRLVEEELARQAREAR